jgi:hypothetical protein
LIAASRFVRPATGFLGRDQQVGVRRAIGSSDPAAQLIQLRETVSIGAVDDDGVGVRDIETVLDNRRRQQHVVSAIDKASIARLELVLAHLSVPDDNPRFGTRRWRRLPIEKIDSTRLWTK